uniref:DUF4175 family protein n=1 Tax=Schlesneria paludicola TaxID=360056 RepID=A0A7C4QM02_9PLAN
MMTLAPLRARLQTLRLARTVVRWGCALSQLALVLLGGWMLAFLLDWGLSLSFAGRAVVLGTWLLGMGWYLAARTLPILRHVEGLEDLALQVERRQRIDSDLIAALQFEAAAPGTWGSPRLTAAVVDYVAEFSQGLNVFDGFSWRPLPSRAGSAVVAVVAAVALAGAYPDHAAAFWNRFWLGSAHYPTRTIIRSVIINGESIPCYHSRPVRLRFPQGTPLRLRVEAEGEIPDEGRVEFRGLQTRHSGGWRLPRDRDRQHAGAEGPAAVAGDPAAKGAPPDVAVFRLESQSLVESLRLRVLLGDATSDPVEIAAIPWPVIDVRWKLRPPSYAPDSHEEIAPGSRQFAVLAGSGVAVELECLNKRLTSAELSIGGQRYPLRSEPQGDRTVWKLPTGTPLDHITEPIPFEIVAVDEDGLSPDPRMQGHIRLRPDRPPRVAAAMVSRKVLPQAKPRISYGAADDFGITRVLMLLEITSVEGETRREERIVWSRREGEPRHINLRGDTVLDLSSYPLQKGDQVQIVLAAEDDRGRASPQRGTSEPLRLEITDRAGILAELLETDQQSARQLDAIILRELGIGGGKK